MPEKQCCVSYQGVYDVTTSYFTLRHLVKMVFTGYLHCKITKLLEKLLDGTNSLFILRLLLDNFGIHKWILHATIITIIF